MNEKIQQVQMLHAMDLNEGWGRADGRKVFQRLIDIVEEHPGRIVFKMSLRGVIRMDMSFASETIVQIAKRYRRSKGFCIVDVENIDLLENIDAAASRSEQPLVVWKNDTSRILGLKPSEGTRDALAFAMKRRSCRAADYASSKKGISIANASMKFKQLWEGGFLMRRENSSESGGVEFLYECIG